MRFISLYCVELRRLALSKFFQIIAVLCLCAPLLGYSVFKSTYFDLMSGKYIANPVLAGTTIGAILWAVFTIVESDRLHRAGTDVLTDSVASPVRLCVARAAAILSLSAVTTLLCSLIYLPFTKNKMEYLFSLDFYLENFLVFMMLTWFISILFAEAFYQITRRMEIAAMLYAALCYFSFSRFSEEDYFSRWLNPLIATYSDGFPSIWPLRIGFYTRIIWLLLAAGIWLFALLCIRKYQKNLVLSFLRGIRKLYIPILSAAFFVSGALLWSKQPFVDHGPEEFVEEELSHDRETIMADSMEYSLVVNPVKGRLSGKAEYNYSHYTGGGERELKINPGYKVTSVTYAGEKLSFEMPNNAVVNGEQSMIFTLPKDKSGILTIEYEGFPAMARYMYPYLVYESIDKEYISLMAGSIAPWDLDSMGPFTINITMPEKLTPFFEYEPMRNFVDNHDGTRTWTARGWGGYLGKFYAADYKTESFAAGDVKIDFVYGKKYEDAVKNNDLEQGIIDVFDYCTKHYGESDYVGKGGLLLQQVSSMLMGGHATEGYSEWYETVLSPETLSDPKKGADATEVFIHEMVHQWWGAYGLDCKEEELWSCEGLTVYSTYRIAKEKYGALYAQKYYLDRWQEDVDEQNREFYYRHPEYLEKLPEKYRANLNDRNEAINWYSRMPLMIKRAEELVGGEEKMDEILQGMYKESFVRDPYNNPFTFQDFLDACNLTEEDLYLE